MNEVSIILPYNLGGFVSDHIIEWLDVNVGQVINSHKSCAVGLGWHLKRVVNDGGNMEEIYIFVFEDAAKAQQFESTFVYSIYRDGPVPMQRSEIEGWTAIELAPANRIYLFDATGARQVQPHMREWFEAQHISPLDTAFEHRIFPSRAIAYFKEPSDAVLFKLTFGGQWA